MNNVLRQWFSKYHIVGLFSLLSLHIIAWGTRGTVFAGVALLGIVVLVFVVSTRSLLYGFLIAMLEIIIGGHGHILDASILNFTVGLRMGIFLAVMAATVFHLVLKRVRPVWITERDAPLAAIVLAVCIGTVVGVVRNNGNANVFDDANAFATLFYVLPLSMIVWNQKAKHALLQVIGLGVSWVVFSTAVLVYAFAHLEPAGISGLYKFVRDSRIAEVTLLSDPTWVIERVFPLTPWFFRVFEPAQIFILFSTLIAFAFTAFALKTRKDRFAMFPVLTVLFMANIAGQSRSFAVALTVGIVALGMLGLVDRVKWKSYLHVAGVSIVAVVLALFALWALIIVPLPARPDLRNTAYFQGQEDGVRDLAVSSRWNLLGPMNNKIAEAPLWGSGFGTPVTFISDDPRVRSISPTGEWTTYRFEWGMHDIWLKMGVFGLLAFGWYFGNIARATYTSIKTKNETKWLSIGFGVSILALYVVHVLTPYLNHPIGLGFMIMALPFFPWATRNPREKQFVAQATGSVQIPRVAKIVTYRK